MVARAARARALMLLGTGSHVGKSLLTAALCRIYHRRGVDVAPFKAQNMSLNSAATPDGFEIGRAQALQAEAAGLVPSVDMNPILLKPSGDMTSQVVARGRIWGQVGASDYHRRRVEELFPIVRASYEALAARHELILLEGAGSPAEINLKQHDIVNMRMADLADAACLLIGDIDRGGVFAALYGTVLLLEPHEQARIRGFIVNKFRGDLSLLAPGLRMMAERLGKPSLGTIPWQRDLKLDEEDSLGLPHANDTGWTSDPSPARPLRIAVIALPSLANFTDVAALEAEPAVDLRLVRSAAALAGADLILLPGSKQTADDLAWLRTQRLDHAIAAHARGSLLIGVCGGFQMLGQSLHDPLGMESHGDVYGLGLLPVRTIMQADKRTTPAHGQLTAMRLFGMPAAACTVSGYEIHIGRTEYLAGAQAFAQLPSGPDGCIAADGRILGTYLHGLFDDDSFRHTLIAAARAFHHLTPAHALCAWRTQRERALNDFADVVQASLNMNAIDATIGLSQAAGANRR